MCVLVLAVLVQCGQMFIVPCGKRASDENFFSLQNVDQTFNRATDAIHLVRTFFMMSTRRKT